MKVTAKVKCPYCGKRVTETKKGGLHKHLNPETKKLCGRCGG